jgi:hypothetical protein
LYPIFYKVDYLPSSEHFTMAAFASTLQNGLLVWEVKKVLDRKDGVNGIEYLIEWEKVPGWPETTWEVYDTLQFSNEEALDLITEVNKFFYCMYCFLKRLICAFCLV